MKTWTQLTYCRYSWMTAIIAPTHYHKWIRLEVISLYLPLYIILYNLKTKDMGTPLNKFYLYLLTHKIRIPLQKQFCQDNNLRAIISSVMLHSFMLHNLTQTPLIPFLLQASNFLLLNGYMIIHYSDHIFCNVCFMILAVL